MAHESTLDVSAHIAGRNALAEAGYSPAQIQKFFYMRRLFEQAALKHSLERKAAKDADHGH